jgi:hypothetical protein
MKQLVTDEDLRLDLVQKGIANVQRFSWQTVAEQVLTQLETAVENSSN